MSGAREPTTVSVLVEPEDLIEIATRVGEAHSREGTLTKADVDEIVAEHYELEPVFEVAGHEEPVADWLAQQTHIELEDADTNDRSEDRTEVEAA